MRTQARSSEIAEVAVRWRDDGVVGFDIAGAEAGFPPTRHLDAFQLVARENFHITIHAGEAFGLPSIWEALQWCGAERLGHGVRIVDDITEPTPMVDRCSVGSPGSSATVACRSRCARPRTCTRAQRRRSPSIPSGCCGGLRFRVTVNTDNRLMSDTSLSKEFAALADTFGYGWDDVEWLTTNAMKSVFAGFDERLRIINERIKPGYALLRAEEVTVGSR